VIRLTVASPLDCLSPTLSPRTQVACDFPSRAFSTFTVPPAMRHTRVTVCMGGHAHRHPNDPPACAHGHGRRVTGCTGARTFAGSTGRNNDRRRVTAASGTRTAYVSERRVCGINRREAHRTWSRDAFHTRGRVSDGVHVTGGHRVAFRRGGICAPQSINASGARFLAVIRNPIRPYRFARISVACAE
jgi:hypothetical protein